MTWEVFNRTLNGTPRPSLDKIEISRVKRDGSEERVKFARESIARRIARRRLLPRHRHDHRRLARRPLLQTQ